MDSTASPKVKTMEVEGVGVRSLICRLWGYRGVLELRDATRKNDKQVNHSHKLAQTKQQVG
jgi:hypothetical protein